MPRIAPMAWRTAMSAALIAAATAFAYARQTLSLLSFTLSERCKYGMMCGEPWRTAKTKIGGSVPDAHHMYSSSMTIEIYSSTSGMEPPLYRRIRFSPFLKGECLPEAEYRLEIGRASRRERGEISV